MDEFVLILNKCFGFGYCFLVDGKYTEQSGNKNHLRLDLAPWCYKCTDGLDISGWGEVPRYRAPKGGVVIPQILKILARKKKLQAEITSPSLSQKPPPLGVLPHTSQNLQNPYFPFLAVQNSSIGDLVTH